MAAGEERRVVFEISCEALEENHAIQVMINNVVKYDEKIIYCDKLTKLVCSIALDKLHLINTLTIKDQTTSQSAVMLYSIEMSIWKKFVAHDEPRPFYLEEEDEGVEFLG